MVLSLLFLLIQLGFVIYLLYYIIAFISAAPFVPSTKRATHTMVRMAGIKKGMNVYDLGSGDGRVLFEAAKIGANAIGYELNPILVLITAFRMIFSPHRTSIHIHWKSLWNADIHSADVVFIYLIPMHLDKLKKKLLTELKPGTRVVSNSFIFENWPITAKNTTEHVYVFTVPQRYQLTGKRNRIQ
jgi:SAM-dependent methyltransferase